MAANLVLEVIDGPAEANMAGHTKTFAKSSGSIGRSDASSWVLPDIERIVSSNHADIHFSGNTYVLIDKSTNGTFLNGSESPIGAGQQVTLNDGDVIVVGHYHIKATLQPVSSSLPDGLGSVDFLDNSDKTTIGSFSADPSATMQEPKDSLDQWFEPGQSDAARDVWGQWDQPMESPLLDASQSVDPLASSATPDPAVSSGVSLDPLDALAGSAGSWDASPQPVSNPSHNSDDWWLSEADNTPAIEQSIAIPSVERAIEPAVEKAIEQTIEPALTPQPVAQPPQPVVHPAPPETSNVAPAPDRQAGTLGERLGLNGNNPELVDQQAAALIQETVSRLMDLLRARSTIKNELRVERTMIETQDNNPLKFSATVDDALGMMFDANRSAFLSPGEAVRDSFDNISDHQVAVMYAMRAAYEYMMEQFDPSRLRTVFERVNGKGLSLNKKAKHWEHYEQWFAGQKKDQEVTYNRLFGDIFADAYEKKLSELSAVRRMP